MSKVKIRMSTTHVDRHGEQMSVEVLHSMAKQINKDIIPLGVEHDPRIPPLGRIIQGEVIKLEDGHFALEGTCELFDGAELEDIGKREIKTRSFKSLEIIADRNYRNKDDIVLLSEIKNLLNSKSPIGYEIKKALDPISIITIGGAFILGNVVNGFFGEIGADGYQLLKKKLGELFQKTKEGEKEKLFVFATTIKKGRNQIDFEVIMTNPTLEQIENFYETGIYQLEGLSKEVFDLNIPFKKITCEYPVNKLIFKFGVLKNGIPLTNEAMQNHLSLIQ